MQQNASPRRGNFRALSLLLIVLLIPVAVVAICEIIGWPFLRATVERLAGEQLQRQVRIAEPFQLRLIGGVRLKVGGLQISAPPEFEAPYFLDSKEANLALRYRDMYRFSRGDDLRVKALEVDGIDLRLLRNAEGLASWHFKRDDNTPDKGFPVVEKLIATRGHADIVDAVYDAELKVDFTTSEGANASKAVSHVDIKGRYHGKPLTGKLDTNGFLPIATHDETAPPVHSKGWVDYVGLRLDFDGTVSDLLGRQRIDSRFVARGISLSVLGNFTNSVLPVTDKFELKGRVQKDEAIWDVAIASAHIGSSDLSGKFRYDPRPERPSLKGQLHGKRLYLADLFPAFGTRTGEGKAVKPRQGKLLADRPLDLPSLNKMDAEVVVRLDYVDLGNAFAEPVRPFSADLNMDRGKLALAKIDARTANGSLAGLISIDAHRDMDKDDQPPPSWRIDLDWKNIDLARWLKISEERKQQAKREGAEESPPAYVTGKLNGRTRLQGHGNSTHELLSSLGGDVLMYVREGTISHLLIELLGLDLAQSLGIKLSGDESLAMQCAVLDFDAKRGVLKPQAALIDTEVTLVLIDGSADVAQEMLDLRLVAKPKNVSPFTVRSPIRIQGTFVDPKVSPEKGPIAAKVLGSVALAFVNPLAALLPFVDLGDAPDGPGPCKQTLTEIRTQNR
jgi:uncharacterized protein involved in outer membrane biogenesis